ncbi:uncharacterized protein PG986_000652 [Apiospora aurea]|uniref:RING-type domain-containing protein n=1 Tax=Apiospora aurea TaxID=335848 RepID=A0ABR1QWA2_9PEZI
MDHPWDIVTAVCFCALGVIVIVSVAKLAAQLERLLPTDKRRSGPVVVPKSLQQAIARLAEVTENKGHRSEGRESCENLCPICLASLYGLPLSEAASSKSDAEGGRAAVSGDLEAGTLKKEEERPAVKEASASIDVAEMAEAAKKTMMDKLQKQKGTSWRPRPIDDEILKMRRCPHMFHARCLATWFLMKRYDCPVCRAAYYQTSNESEESLSGRESVRPASLGIPILPFW